jgi:hypothetical protein
MSLSVFEQIFLFGSRQMRYHPHHSQIVDHRCNFHNDLTITTSPFWKTSQKSEKLLDDLDFWPMNGFPNFWTIIQSLCCILSRNCWRYIFSFLSASCIFDSSVSSATNLFCIGSFISSNPTMSKRHMVKIQRHVGFLQHFMQLLWNCPEAEVIQRCYGNGQTQWLHFLSRLQKYFCTFDHFDLTGAISSLEKSTSIQSPLMLSLTKWFDLIMNRSNFVVDHEWFIAVDVSCPTSWLWSSDWFC